jgi:hypothetical protein
MPIRCRAHVLRDYQVGAAMESDEIGRQAMAEERRRNYVAFTCLLYRPADRRLYCGITAYDADIFYAFDIRTGAWESLGWAGVGEQFDVKIHRALIWDEADQAIYGATACYRTHDLVQAEPGVFYVAETDNPWRSGYLWECEVKL